MAVQGFEGVPMTSKVGLLFVAAMLAAPVVAQNSIEIPDRVEDIILSRCALCHGAEGESASAVYPRLAAQHPDYLAKQLRDFRDGRRKSKTMGGMAADLSEDDVRGLAAFFSSKKAGSRRAGDSDLAAVGRYIFQRGNSYSGVPACVACHGRTVTEHNNYRVSQANIRRMSKSNSRSSTSVTVTMTTRSCIPSHRN